MIKLECKTKRSSSLMSSAILLPRSFKRMLPSSFSRSKKGPQSIFFWRWWTWLMYAVHPLETVETPFWTKPRYKLIGLHQGKVAYQKAGKFKQLGLG